MDLKIGFFPFLIGYYVLYFFGIWVYRHYKSKEIDSRHNENQDTNSRYNEVESEQRYNELESSNLPRRHHNFPHLRDLFFNIPAITGILLGLSSFWFHPVLEDDWYRFFWDGLLFSKGISPYAKAPIKFFQDMQFSEYSQILSGINYPDWKTIYFPVFQYLFRIAQFFDSSSYNGLRFVVLVGTLLFLVLLSREVSRSVFLFLFICPFLWKETVFSIHFDIWIGLGLLLFYKSYLQQSMYATGILLGILVCSKPYCIIFFPLLLPIFQKHGHQFPAAAPSGIALSPFRNSSLPKKNTNISANQYLWKNSLSNLISFFLTSILLCIPFWEGNAFHFFESFLSFPHGFEFNSIYYAVLKFLVPAKLAILASYFLYLVCWCVLYFLLWRKKILTVSFFYYSLLLFFLFSPVFNPWYYLAILPFWVMGPTLKPSGWVLLFVFPLQYFTPIYVPHLGLFGAYDHPNALRILSIFLEGTSVFLDFYGFFQKNRDLKSIFSNQEC